MVTIRKIIIIIAAITFFSGLMAYAYLHVNYASTMPREPRPEAGRTHLITVNHGAKVYVTRDEMILKERIERFFFSAGGACFIVIAVLQGLYKTFGND